LRFNTLLILCRQGPLLFRHRIASVNTRIVPDIDPFKAHSWNEAGFVKGGKEVNRLS